MVRGRRGWLLVAGRARLGRACPLGTRREEAGGREGAAEGPPVVGSSPAWVTISSAHSFAGTRASQREARCHSNLIWSIQSWAFLALVPGRSHDLNHRRLRYPSWGSAIKSFSVHLTRFIVGGSSISPAVVRNHRDDIRWTCGLLFA